MSLTVPRQLSGRARYKGDFPVEAIVVEHRAAFVRRGDRQDPFARSDEPTG
jgi:hypothetical protein